MTTHRLTRIATLSLALIALLGSVSSAQLSATAGQSVGTGSAPALKELDPADLAFWKTIRSPVLSNDGKWFAYQLAPNEGDAEVVIRPTADGKELRFAIGEPTAGGGGPELIVLGALPSAPVAISGDARWTAFTTYPKATDAKRARTQRRPLQNGVSIVNLATGDKRDFERVRRFVFAGERPNFLLMQRYGDAPAAPPTPSAGASAGAAGGAPAAPAAAGSDLLLLDLRSGAVTNVGNVGEFALDEQGEWLAWTIETRDRVGNGVHARNLRTDAIRVLDSDNQVYRRLTWADSGLALAVLRGKPDSAASDTAYAVVGFTGFGTLVTAVVTYAVKDSSDFPAGMRISPSRSPRWATDQSAIFFGISEKRTGPDPKTSRPNVNPAAGTPGAMQSTGAAASSDDDLPTLVLWHGKEPRLQSQQQVQESADKSFSFLAEFRVAERKFIRLGTDEMRDVTVAPRDKWAIGTDRRTYELRDNIDGGARRDVYAIDLRTGERTKLLAAQRFVTAASPDGTKLLYYADGNYHVYDFATKATRVVTEGVATSFINREDDHNVDRPPTPLVGWASDAQSVLLSDNWDIWKVPVKMGSPVNLTGNGRSEKIRYRFRIAYNPKERGIDLTKPQYFAAYGERTKKEGLIRLVPNKPGFERLYWEDASFAVRRARDAETFVFTRQTVRNFPDFWVAENSFVAPRRLTEANPQQKDYAWSSGARLIDYVSDKGDSLQAALYLPANYEPGKKYPTVVYIYEKLSQGLHSFAVPNETRALNPSVYTSRGYAVLQPDIVYKINDPGMSAVWCVVPAVKAAIATGIVDPAHVGLHGHSWGGYQTSFLITQTGKLFKSAIAGAALTDLVSMYSSVYWNTGSANQPIFESSQGRFKGDFLENYDAYIRNSPAFHANKVEVPVVLLHNEKDGAVDFNQGITFFNTLRAQNKDVVLLQYVGENHGLAQPKNQKDYAVRMREFFDHYLKDAPAPDWWVNGVPRLKMEEHLKARQKKDEKKVAS